MNALSENVVLILVGLLALAFNLIWSIWRANRGRTRATIPLVGIGVIACAVVGFGLTRLPFASSADFPPFAVGAPGGSAPQASVGTRPASGGTQTNGTGVQLPPQAQTAIASGAIPPQLQTAIASGNLPPQMMTAMASGALPPISGGVPLPSGGQNAANGNSTPAVAGNIIGATAPQAPPAITDGMFLPIGLLADHLAPLVAIAFAILSILVSLWLLQRERRTPDFMASTSAGLLNAGTGVFVLVAAIVIPLIPGQLSPSTASVAILPTSSSMPAIRLPSQPVQPTFTSTPRPTGTALPTLTTAPSATEVVLSTAIAYQYVEDKSEISCTVTAKTLLNLRPDPSTKQAAIGKVFAGSLLSVTAQSEDKKWWRVVSKSYGISVEGWVSAEYVKADAHCEGERLPLIAQSVTTVPSANIIPR